jgi:hypothetical protein
MASKVCLADNDQSTFSIRDPASQFILPDTISLDYTIYVDEANPTRSMAESILLSSPLCPVLDPDYFQLHRKSITVQAVNMATNPKEYTATVTWNRWEPEDSGEGAEFLSGNISLQTQTAYRAFARQSVTWAPGLAADEKIDLYDLINVSLGSGPEDQGSVSGVEVPYPVMSFSIRKIYAKGTVSLKLLNALYGYVARPNVAAWRGFPPHSVRITGIVPDNSDAQNDYITWNLEAHPGDPEIEIRTAFGDGSGPIKISKRGLDYVWLLNRNAESGGGYVVESPVAAIVDQLAPEIDLNPVLPPPLLP